MNKETKKIGFSAEKEEQFLKRLANDIRRINLEQELKTQLAEDFGLLEFTLKYNVNSDGKIVDIMSGQEIVELTSRGEIKEETESIRQIEEGLINDPEKTWIHFSPKNEELGYPSNCVDFWRMVDGKVVWNRMVVNQDFEEMNIIRTVLSGKEKVKNEREILALPVGVKDLKLAEIWDVFRLSDTKNQLEMKYIEKVVAKYIGEFASNFGEEITKEKDLIFRLYSVCFNALKYRRDQVEMIISRKELDNYMFGVMREVRIEKSFGCSVSTIVGSFGEKIGWYVTSSGEVKHGEIPEKEGYKECKGCGYWYKGEKCPFC